MYAYRIVPTDRLATGELVVSTSERPAEGTVTLTLSDPDTGTVRHVTRALGADVPLAGE